MLLSYSPFRVLHHLKFISFAIILTAFRGSPGIEISKPISAINIEPAGGAYFTNDHLGNPVLCWTEGEGNEGQLYFATYDKGSKRFNDTISVTPSAGTGLHPESMNKIAYKSDGTIVAVFARKHPTKQNKYAGSILYSQSFDDGKTWTAEKFLHTDTISNSRSFFDIAPLPDGEVGAVWVDGRLQRGEAGSSIYFAKTKSRDGFTPDTQIGETVCECCRTDLYTDPAGNVHIVYRDIEASIKGQIRDFAHIISADSGETFSASKKISQDNWNIAGCPHTGATMSGTSKGLAIAWFTAGGTPGVYYTVSTDKGKSFQKRLLISEDARHPQITSANNKLIMVSEVSKQSSHDMHASHGAPGEQSKNGIVLTLINVENNATTKRMVAYAGEFPVLCAINANEVLVAYCENKRVLVRKVAH